MRIIKTPVTNNPVSLACPSCGRSVVTIFEHHVETPDAKLWTRFGQPIKGAWAVPTPASISGAFLAWDFCIGCAEEYDVARADFIKRNHQSSLLRFDVRKLKVNNYVCQLDEPIDGVPEKWLMFEYLTPVGKFHSNRFGPFPCARDFQRASNILKQVWPVMRQLNLNEGEPHGRN